MACKGDFNWTYMTKSNKPDQEPPGGEHAIANLKTENPPM